MSLERPLVSGGESHSLILISFLASAADQEEPTAMSVTALNDNLLRYRQAPIRLTERLRKRFRQKDWNRATNVLHELAGDHLTRTQSMGQIGIFCRQPWGMWAEEKISGNLGLVPDDDSGLLDVLLESTRLAAGLSLYLGMGGTECARSAADWKPSVESGRLTRAITSEAQVCEVASMHRLSTAEVAAIEGVSGHGSGNLVSAYFRRGHWRKKPGQGADPLAPKTTWVRPTLVCRDRLPEAGLPVGAVTALGR